MKSVQFGQVLGFMRAELGSEKGVKSVRIFDNNQQEK